MARLAHFRVCGRFHRAGGRPGYATVSIDRDTRVVTVRPLRCRTTFTGTLDALAEVLVQRELMRLVREKKAAKRGGRR